MKSVSLLFCKRTILISGIICLLVALTLALAVIPSVKADTHPGANPDFAVPAFWVNIGVNLFSAVILGLISTGSKYRNSIPQPALIIVLGVIIILLGLALADAATAFQNHGPSMQTSSVILFICAAADFLVGLMVVISTSLFIKYLE